MTGTTPIDTIIQGDCLGEMKRLPDRSIDAIVTDPPYELAFMGKKWDASGIAYNVDMWGECLRVLKPGGHLLAFGGARTYHRMACAIEDAGFEIRDSIHWCYGSGFPKSLDISKQLDRTAAKTSEDVKKLKDELRRVFDASGLTLKELNSKCGFEASGYLRKSSTWGSVLPTVEKWQAMRNAIGTDEDFSFEFKEIEREVIGKNPNGFGPNKGASLTHNLAAHPDITAPSTDAAKQWAGWGSALKPAHESIILARKPLDVDTGTYLNLKSLLDIEAQLWCLLPANVAEKNFGLSPSEHEKVCVFAQWNAEEKSNIQGILSDLMDTQLSKSVVLSSLNIVLSWRCTLEGIFYQENRSITKTAIDQITDLKTLNSCLSTITARSIIQARIQADGAWLNVLPVARYLHAVCLNLNATQERFAAESAIRLEAQSCRAGAGKVLHEPVVLARKPLEEATIAENVLRWGCGGLNIDGCRISTSDNLNGGGYSNGESKGMWTPGKEGGGFGRLPGEFEQPMGRFPSNLIHDASPEVLAEFAKAGTTKSGAMKKEVPAYEGESTTGFLRGRSGPSNQHGDSGSVARFFQSCSFQEEDIPAFAYYAKAGPSERNGSTHPTMKPLSLMRYLCKLITPPGGLILDPFGGSGTTGIAAIKEGFHYILIEQQEEYCEIARKRVAAVPARLDRWAEAEG